MEEAYPAKPDCNVASHDPVKVGLRVRMHMTAMSVLTSSYDYRLVALSIVLAIFASYAALDLAGRVTSAQGWSRSKIKELTVLHQGKSLGMITASIGVAAFPTCSTSPPRVTRGGGCSPLPRQARRP
jgi:hypothetical protein